MQFKDFERRADRSTRNVLVVIAVLLALIAVRLWDNAPPFLPVAHAQIPDTARQRQDLVVEARRTNELLQQILDHLRTKPVKVTPAAADKQADPRGAVVPR